ncbi:MAG: type I restriction enzyme endonuclease domain-containing protein, partial [Sphingomonadales bacterium]
TKRTITERMDEDPAFYKRFSELLEETIRAYRERRLSERDYLNDIVDLATKVAQKDRGQDVPHVLHGNDDGQAFFGLLKGRLRTQAGEPVDGDEAGKIAIDIISIISSHLIVGVWSNEVAQNNMRNAIDDYFFDVLRDQRNIHVELEVLDGLEHEIMSLAKARFP